MSVRTNRRYGGVDLDELRSETDAYICRTHGPGHELRPQEVGLRGDEDPATLRGGPERSLHEGGAHQRT